MRPGFEEKEFNRFDESIHGRSHMRIQSIPYITPLRTCQGNGAIVMPTNFRHAIITSSVVATGSVIAGLVMAFYWDLPASGVIGILSFLCFLLLFSLRLMRKPISFLIESL
jgi:hypothetical protein